MECLCYLLRCHFAGKLVVASQNVGCFLRLVHSPSWRVTLGFFGWVVQLASVIQKVDNAIHQINLYPLDSAIGVPNPYPLDSDLSGG